MWSRGWKEIWFREWRKSIAQRLTGQRGRSLEEEPGRLDRDMATHRFRKEHVQVGSHLCRESKLAGSGAWSCFWVNINVEPSNKV